MTRSISRNLLRPFSIALLLLTLLPATASGAEFAAPVARDIERAISKHLPKGATIGISIVKLDQTPGGVPGRVSHGNSTTVFEKNASRSMITASNLKVVTSAAAVEGLGADFRFKTKMLARKNEAGGYDVVVVGDGDPSFGDVDLLSEVDGWGSRTVFKTWADALAKAGVKNVDTLHLDASVFDEDVRHPNWPDNQRHRWYEAQVGGLNLNINCLDIHLTRDGSIIRPRLDPPTAYVDLEDTCRAGNKNAVIIGRRLGTNEIVLSGQTNAKQQAVRVTIDGPTMYFGTVLAETLREAGIGVSQVQSTPGAGKSLGGLHLLAVHETPIAPVLGRTNKDSINLYAEALLKRLAHQATGQPGSWKAGNDVVKTYVRSLGGDDREVNLDDGSGMSRDNRVSARVITAILADQFEGDHFEVYRNSLSEAGVDGTLKKRFAGNDRLDLRGRVFGKTGFINYVSTMSGYLQARDGTWYAFAVLVNDCPNNFIWKAKELQDDVVIAVDRSTKEADVVRMGSD